MLFFGRQFRTPSYCANQCGMLGQRGEQKLGRHLKPKRSAKKRRFEPREAPRVVLTRALSRRGDSSRRLESVRGDLLRNLSHEGETPRTLVRLVPRIDQGCHALPQAEAKRSSSKAIDQQSHSSERTREEHIGGGGTHQQQRRVQANECQCRGNYRKDVDKKFNASAIAREEWHLAQAFGNSEIRCHVSRLTKLRYEVLTSSNVQEGQQTRSMLSKKIIKRTVPSRRQTNMDMNPSISVEPKTSDIATAKTS